MSDFRQQQANEELHERTLLALEHVKALGATDDDLRLLCYHAGINYDKEVKREFEQAHQ